MHFVADLSNNAVVLTNDVTQLTLDSDQAKQQVTQLTLDSDQAKQQFTQLTLDSDQAKQQIPNFALINHIMAVTAIVRTNRGNGTCVHIGDGQFITAWHVVDHTVRVTVGIDEHHAEIIAYDVAMDLALLQSKFVPDQAANISMTDTPPGAVAVIHAGYQLGLDQAIITDGYKINNIVSCPVAFGSSGGGVWTMDGKLVGIVQRFRLHKSRSRLIIIGKDGKRINTTMNYTSPAWHIGYVVGPEVLRKFLEH